MYLCMNYLQPRHILRTFAIVLIICLAPVVSVSFAAGSTTVDPEDHFMTLVNQVRTNPLGYAKYFGVDVAMLRYNRPALYALLESGLPPLKRAEKVSTAAAWHTKDMVARNYYTSVSPEGESPYQRIMRTGYPLNTTAESLGMVTFFNFMAPSQAVTVMFRKMFISELLERKIEDLAILHPGTGDAGISMDGGVFELSGGKINAYVLCLDVAVPLVSSFESELFELINQFRREPLETAAMLGISPVAEADPVPGELPPLSLNPILCKTSSTQAENAVAGNFVNLASGTTTIENRLTANGYYPETAYECSRHLSSVPPVKVENAAQFLFKKAIEDEIKRPAENRILLNPEVMEIGITFRFSSSAGLEGGLFDTAAFLNYTDKGVLVMITASAPNSTAGSVLVGTVYTDVNGDGLFGYQEGSPGSAIEVWRAGESTSVIMYTNTAGGFSLPVQAGQYKVSLGGETPLTVQVANSEPVQNAGVIFQLAP